MAPMTTGTCGEKLRLMEKVLTASSDLVTVLNQQISALSAGDRDFARFDRLIRLANEHKRQARDAYKAHIQKHSC
jgi:hypothetical protein